MHDKYLLPLPFDKADMLLERHLDEYIFGSRHNFQRIELTRLSVKYESADLGTLKLYEISANESELEVIPPVSRFRNLTLEEKERIEAATDQEEKERIVAEITEQISNESKKWDEFTKSSLQSVVYLLRLFLNQAQVQHTTDESSSIKLEEVELTPKKEKIIFQRKKPGAKPEPLYDEAYKTIEEGKFTNEAYNKAYDNYCQKANLTKQDKDTNNAFKAAIRRRRNGLATQ
jgi:hypothetical protein